jgi:hypothetical protein
LSNQRSQPDLDYFDATPRGVTEYAIQVYTLPNKATGMRIVKRMPSGACMVAMIHPQGRSFTEQDLEMVAVEVIDHVRSDLTTRSGIQLATDTTTGGSPR